MHLSQSPSQGPWFLSVKGSESHTAQGRRKGRRSDLDKRTVTAKEARGVAELVATLGSPSALSPSLPRRCRGCEHAQGRLSPAATGPPAPPPAPSLPTCRQCCFSGPGAWLHEAGQGPSAGLRLARERRYRKREGHRKKIHFRDNIAPPLCGRPLLCAAAPSSIQVSALQCCASQAMSASPGGKGRGALPSSPVGRGLLGPGSHHLAGRRTRSGLCSTTDPRRQRRLRPLPDPVELPAPRGWQRPEMCCCCFHGLYCHLKGLPQPRLPGAPREPCALCDMEDGTSGFVAAWALLSHAPSLRLREHTQPVPFRIVHSPPPSAPSSCLHCPALPPSRLTWAGRQGPWDSH